MRRAAAVLATGDWLFVCAAPMSERGLSVLGAVTTLDARAVPETIGDAVREALEGSRQPAPSLTDRSLHASYEPMLAVTGAASLRDLLLSTVMISIEDDGAALRLELVEKPNPRAMPAIPVAEAAAPDGGRVIGAAVLKLLAIAAVPPERPPRRE